MPSDVDTEEATLWFAHYWEFLPLYLNHRFGQRYCLSAEASLERHARTPLIPKALTILANVKEREQVLLPHGTSLLLKPGTPTTTVEIDRLRCLPLARATEEGDHPPLELEIAHSSSPYSARIQALWRTYRKTVAAILPPPPRTPSPLDTSIRPSKPLREEQVYIHHLRYVPPPPSALPKTLDTLWQCLEAEPHPGVRAILGHTLFITVHPYSDGNGHAARDLMNQLLELGGYPACTIGPDTHATYNAEQNRALLEGNIAPFTHFIAKRLES